MTNNILHEYLIRKKKHLNAAVFFWTLSIVCIVTVGVNLYIGEDQLPPIFKGKSIYFAMAAVALAIPGFYIYFTKKLKLLIYKTGQQLCVEIEDKEALEPILIQSPFTISKQWVHVDTGSRIKIKQLNLTFINSHHECVFTIYGNYGALQDPPMGWEYVNIYSRENTTPYYMAKNKFTCDKFESIAIDVETELKIMETKKTH